MKRSSRLNGLTHSTQSSSFVLSTRHSKMSSDGGVRSSIPTNSKMVELLLLAGARSMRCRAGRRPGTRRSPTRTPSPRPPRCRPVRGDDRAAVRSPRSGRCRSGLLWPFGLTGAARHERLEVERALEGRVGDVGVEDDDRGRAGTSPPVGGSNGVSPGREARAVEDDGDHAEQAATYRSSAHRRCPRSRWLGPRRCADRLPSLPGPTRRRPST